MLWLYRTQDMSEERMLTRTQIENATTEELERLRVRIEAELEGRGSEERDHQSTVEVLEGALQQVQERQEARPVPVSVLLSRWKAP
jgi:hypothetical protein